MTGSDRTPSHSTVQPFHVIAKPTGAACNLACQYCFFLSKAALYPAGESWMSDQVLEAYLRQTIESPASPEVAIAWQGGEPTLMGIEFFRRALEIERRIKPAGLRILNSFQTNGVLLDADWCRFLADNGFLIGLSLDGPPKLHDRYRVDRGGHGTSAKVVRAARLLSDHKVDYNVLCTVHSANADQPLDVYRYIRDEIGARFIQFIPIVERVEADMVQAADAGWGANPPVMPLYQQRGTAVTRRSVRPQQWGSFLNGVFDEWVRRDVGKVYVQAFDVALALWLGHPSPLCIFAETCGRAAALEHNGDLYACDHFVEPRYLLGNILSQPIVELLGSEKQAAFGLAKQRSLPRYCRDCVWLFACHGECPRNRFRTSPSGEQGLNYLCAGYRSFFAHVDPLMRYMAGEIQANRPPANVMTHVAARTAAAESGSGAIGRNDLCPCGSGKRYKHCHGH